jgi:hypothetical protein
MIPNEQMASRPTPSVQKSMPTMYSWRESSLHHAHLYIYISTHNVYIYSLYIYWNNFHFVHHSKQSKLTPPPSGRTSIFKSKTSKSYSKKNLLHHWPRHTTLQLRRGNRSCYGGGRGWGMIKSSTLLFKMRPPSKTVLK